MFNEAFQKQTWAMQWTIGLNYESALLADKKMYVCEEILYIVLFITK